MRQSERRKSALNFYKNKILTNPNYVPPEEYDDGESYVPTDMSDIGQILPGNGIMIGMVENLPDECGITIIG